MKKQMKLRKCDELYLGSIKRLSKATGTLHAIIKAVWREVDPEDTPDYPSEYVFDMSDAFMNVSHEFIYLGQRACELAVENATRDEKHLLGNIFECSPSDLDNFAQSAARIKSYFSKEGIFKETAEKLGYAELVRVCLNDALVAMMDLIASIVGYSVEVNTLIINPGE